MGRQKDRWLLCCKRLDTLQGQKRHFGIVSDSIHLFGLQKSLSICGISGKKVRHALSSHHDREMTHSVSWSGDEENPAVSRYGMRSRKWAYDRSFHFDQFRFEPYRPALRKCTTDHFSL